MKQIQILYTRQDENTLHYGYCTQVSRASGLTKMKYKHEESQVRILDSP